MFPPRRCGTNVHSHRQLLSSHNECCVHDIISKMQKDLFYIKVLTST